VLDKDGFKKVIDEAVKAEADYLAKLGNGRIAGLGGSNEGPAFNEAGLVESFKALGLSESAAKLAAQGR
jgi:hypothetical protein